MADSRTRVKILYTLNSSSQLLLARTSLPSLSPTPSPSSRSPSTSAAQQQQYLPLPLPSILTAILHCSPELTADPTHDWSVYALDPREARRGGGALSGVMEGRGLMSWVLGGAEGEEVWGRVGADGEVEIGLRLQETKAISQQAHLASLASLTRSPCTPYAFTPASSHPSSAPHTHAYPALRPPQSSPLNAYPTPSASSDPAHPHPSARRAPSKAPATGLHLPQPSTQVTRVKAEPSPSPSPFSTPLSLPPLPASTPAPPPPQPVGLGLHLPPRPSNPQPPAQPAKIALPPGPIPPETLANIVGMLGKAGGEGLLSALAGFLGVAPAPGSNATAATTATANAGPSSTHGSNATNNNTDKKPTALAGAAKKPTKVKDESTGTKSENKENRRPNQPSLVMSKDGPCQNCGRVVTTVWRRPKSTVFGASSVGAAGTGSGTEEGGTAQLLCNPCGIYQEKYSIPRPPSMWGDTEVLPKVRKRKYSPVSSSSSLCFGAASAEPLAILNEAPVIHVQGEGRKRRKKNSASASAGGETGYFGRAVKAVRELESRSSAPAPAGMARPKSEAEELADGVRRALGGLPFPALGPMLGSEMEVEGMVGPAAAPRREERKREKERIVIELDDDGEVVVSSPSVAAAAVPAQPTPAPAQTDPEPRSQTAEPQPQEEQEDESPREPSTPRTAPADEGGSLFTPASCVPSTSGSGRGTKTSSDAGQMPSSPSPASRSGIPTLVLPSPLGDEGDRDGHGEGERELPPPSSPPGTGQRFDFSGLPPSSPVLMPVLLESEAEGDGELEGDGDSPGEEGSGEDGTEGEGMEMEVDAGEMEWIARQGEMTAEEIAGLFAVHEASSHSTTSDHQHDDGEQQQQQMDGTSGTQDYTFGTQDFDFGMLGLEFINFDATTSTTPSSHHSSSSLPSSSLPGSDSEPFDLQAALDNLANMGMEMDGGGMGYDLSASAEELEQMLKSLDGDLGVLM